MAHGLLMLKSIAFSLPSIMHGVDRTSINVTPVSLEQHMSDLTKKQFFLWARAAKTPRIPLPLTAIVACLLLSIISLLTGCGGGGGGEGAPSITTTSTPTGTTATLSWDPVQDPTITEYRLHYGSQPQNYPLLASSASPTVTVTNLDNTRYYFAVTAYNGAESGLSNEVCYDFQANSPC
jgi:hypothetical protein